MSLRLDLWIQLPSLMALKHDMVCHQMPFPAVKLAVIGRTVYKSISFDHRKFKEPVCYQNVSWSNRHDSQVPYCHLFLWSLKCLSSQSSSQLLSGSRSLDVYPLKARINFSQALSCILPGNSNLCLGGCRELISWSKDTQLLLLGNIHSFACFKLVLRSAICDCDIVEHAIS